MQNETLGLEKNKCVAIPTRTTVRDSASGRQKAVEVEGRQPQRGVASCLIAEGTWKVKMTVTYKIRYVVFLVLVNLVLCTVYNLYTNLVLCTVYNPYTNLVLCTVYNPYTN